MSFIDGLKSAAQYTPIGRMVFNGENPLEAVVNATGKQFEGIGNFFADHTPVGRMIVHGEGVITSTYNSGLGNEVAELFDAHDEVQGFCEDVDSALGQIAFGPALPFSFASAL